MSKYSNRCKRDLEIDNFYSYKKSICKQCVFKKLNVIFVTRNLMVLIYLNI